MNTNEKYTLADEVIEHAIKCGAEQASATILDNRSTEIEIRDQKIDSLKESNQRSLSISIYTEKKYSSHSTNRMKRKNYSALLRKLSQLPAILLQMNTVHCLTPTCITREAVRNWTPTIRPLKHWMRKQK
jgi:hypothetical protein